jgi:hypothetical protein
MVEQELDPGSISMHEVMSEADAEAVAFPGSPTIRVDGADVSEPRPDMPTGLVPRMYLHRNRRIAPVPDPLDVREALARASS